jgi:hypothetical protein
MWEQKKTTHVNQVVKFDFEDFATLVVEKRKNKQEIIDQYSINFEIFDVCTETVYMYDLKEVESCLKFIRTAVEKLYEEISYLNYLEIQSWVEDFEDELSAY